MDRLTRVATVVVAALFVVACSDDDGGGKANAAPGDGADTTVTVTSKAPVAGGLDIPELPGTVPAPVPSLGFGVAYPEGWQATLLTDEAFRRLEQGDLAQPSFLDAARNVATSGAVFYAAGVDGEGRVGELKIDVQDGTDTSPGAVRATADQVAASDAIAAPTVVEVGEGRIRVDYRIEGTATDDGGEPIETYGSQLFVPDGDRLWSLIVTSEDQASQDALLSIVDRTFTLD